MIKIRKKTAVAAMAMMLAIPFAMNACADVTDGYERTKTALGSDAGRYSSSVNAVNETVTLIDLKKAEKAAFHTDTNVRAEPTAESERLTTLGTADKVMIWGYTDNGWASVYCEDGNGTRWKGYVKGDLLDLSDGTSAENTEIQTPDEAAQSEE